MLFCFIRTIFDAQGEIVAIFRHVMELIVNPFFLILLFYTVLVIKLWLYGSTFKIRVGFMVVLLLLLFVSTGWFAKGLTRKLEDQYLAVNKIDPGIHWVVVLSGGQSAVPGIPANSLLYNQSIKRLVEGLRLYRQLPEAKLVLSGAGYRFAVPEAAHLSELAAWFAIPKENIVLEDTSINTSAQIKAIKEIVRDEPFYLVTSAIHMPRSILLCQKAGLHPVAAPTDFTFYWHDEHWEKRYVPNPYNLYYLSMAMHEVLGQLWENRH